MLIHYTYLLSDKMARFTKVPPSKLFVAKGKAARFEWEYTYDNRNIEFHPESHVWAYINQNNQWVTIATEKRDQSWSTVINTTTCPARLLNPLRVSIKQPATLVISNVTEADNGKYGCRLRLQREFPINSTSILIVTGEYLPFDCVIQTTRGMHIAWFHWTSLLCLLMQDIPVRMNHKFSNEFSKSNRTNNMMIDF